MDVKCFLEGYQQPVTVKSGQMKLKYLVRYNRVKCKRIAQCIILNMHFFSLNRDKYMDIQTSY